MSVADYQRCPACGDRGDLAHVAACTGEAIEMLRARLRGFAESDAEYVNGFRNGVRWFADRARVQYDRRGAVAIEELRNVGLRLYSKGRRDR